MKLLHVVSPALGLASHESESPRRASGRCGAAFAYRYQPANGRGIANGAFVRFTVAAGAGRLWVRGEDARHRDRCVSSTGLLIPYGVTFRNSAWNGIHGFTPPQPAPLL